jgi:hypothetical protein
LALGFTYRYSYKKKKLTLSCHVLHVTEMNSQAAVEEQRWDSAHVTGGPARL